MRKYDDTFVDPASRDDGNLTCREAQPLVGAYLDGELSEPRAALLRKHLLECFACRSGVQDGKTLQRWFAPLREAASERSGEFSAPVPSGFAARVARRAFAGDDGERRVGPAPAPHGNDGRILRFVTGLTALAAAAAILLAVAYRAQSRPSGDRLSADDRAPLTVLEIRDRLERLNREAEKAPKRDPAEREGASQAEPRSGD
jgi:hypothetical protein